MRESHYSESVAAAILHADIISPSFRPPLQYNDYKYDPQNIFFAGPYITASQREFRAGLILNGFKSVIGPKILSRKEAAKENGRKWQEMFVRLQILASNTASDMLAQDALNEIMLLAEERNKELASELIKIDFKLIKENFDLETIQKDLLRWEKSILELRKKEEKAIELKAQKTEEFDIQAKEFEKTWKELIPLENMAIIKRYPDGVFPGSLRHQNKDMTTIEPGTELYIPLIDGDELKYIKISMDEKNQIKKEVISETDAPEDLKKSQDFVASDLNERIFCYHDENGIIQYKALYNGEARELGELERSIIQSVLDNNPSAHITLHMSKAEIEEVLTNAQEVLKNQGDAYDNWEAAHENVSKIEKECDCAEKEHKHLKTKEDDKLQSISELNEERKSIEAEQEVYEKVKSLENDPSLQAEFKKYVYNEPVSEEFKTIFNRTVDALEKQNELPALRNIVPPPEFHDEEELMVKPRYVNNAPRFPSYTV